MHLRNYLLWLAWHLNIFLLCTACQHATNHICPLKYHCYVAFRWNHCQIILLLHFYKMFQAWISKFSVKKDNQQSLVTQYVPNSMLHVIYIISVGPTMPIGVSIQSISPDSWLYNGFILGGSLLPWIHALIFGWGAVLSDTLFGCLRKMRWSCCEKRQQWCDTGHLTWEQIDFLWALSFSDYFGKFLSRCYVMCSLPSMLSIPKNHVKALKKITNWKEKRSHVVGCR